jgi:assimilatory nitrate reductase catalytic subunit
VQISKLDLPYPLAVLRRCADHSEALALLQRARRSLVAFPYATVSLYGRQSPLVVFRAAAKSAVGEMAIAELDRLFELDGEEGAIVYIDASRKIAKKAIARNGRLLGVRLAGEALAQGWLKRAMAEDDLDATMIRFALAPTAKPPVSLAPRNIVCKCADVSDVQIKQKLAQGADLSVLQERLKCGSFCGGCVPDIKRMMKEYSPQQAAAA